MNKTEKSGLSFIIIGILLICLAVLLDGCSESPVNPGPIERAHISDIQHDERYGIVYINFKIRNIGGVHIEYWAATFRVTTETFTTEGTIIKRIDGLAQGFDLLKSVEIPGSLEVSIGASHVINVNLLNIKYN